MKKVWFITGSSRGLGRSLTEAVLHSGDSVVATARNTEALKDLKEKYPGQLQTLQLDVTDEQAVTSVVNEAVSLFGRIDVVVNNAGFGITGAAEAFTREQMHSQIDTNFWGAVYVTRAVLPHLRKQQSGRILQVSSIGGRVGTPGVSIYQAAKFALVGFSEAVSKEVAPLGIKITIIEPGGFRTDWAGSSMTYATNIPDYDQTVGVMAKVLRSDFVPSGDPVKAAKVMIDVANHAQPPLHLLLGSDAAGLLKRANADREEEFNKWLDVTLSTDHDDAVNFFETDAAQILTMANANN
ncbi:SDR family oxidoreductase [Danxiaibacter flavus]|uniref:SDR family oxidoreductase n=1 Tax=Danxiaibacter flavus TaxID=3049108 RepID=A0ABV3ZDL1_9BACT|nr:SDR family oxidoreductase [Chitinophagaceae bacterium DXS]